MRKKTMQKTKLREMRMIRKKVRKEVRKEDEEGT